MKKTSCAFLLIFLMMVWGVSSCGSSNSSDSSIRTSFGGITLLDHGITSCIDEPDLPCTVSGTIRNDSAYNFSMVTVKVSFLDDNGKSVTTGIAVAEHLKRKGEFEFSVESQWEDLKTDKYDINIETKH